MLYWKHDYLYLSQRRDASLYHFFICYMEIFLRSLAQSLLEISISRQRQFSFLHLKYILKSKNKSKYSATHNHMALTIYTHHKFSVIEISNRKIVLLYMDVNLLLCCFWYHGNAKKNAMFCSLNKWSNGNVQ